MELPDLGDTCVICNRLDYLPFKCTHCAKIVCIDHRTNHGSDCPLKQDQTVQNATTPSKSELTLRGACDFCRKITLKLELSECSHCANWNCLYHRHQAQHQCPKLAEDKSRVEREAKDQAEKRQQALNQLKETLKTNTSGGASSQTKASPAQIDADPKKRELARRVRLMRIKQSARGPPNTLPEDRIYFEVKFLSNDDCQFSDKTKNGNTLKIYATPKHTIGRLVDWSADEMKIVNKNNVDGANKLVFMKQTWPPGGETITLDNAHTFSDFLDNKTLENGDELILTHL